MDKWVKIAGAVLISLALAGCGGGKNAGAGGVSGQKQTVEQTLQEQIEQEDGQAQSGAGRSADDQSGAKKQETDEGQSADNAGGQDGQMQEASGERKSGIDVDLTRLSSTMVYSEVYNMMTVPADYIGKTVKMTGTFSVYHDEQQNVNYYACIIQDATACCSQGMEFVLTDRYSYPEDYPTEGDEVTVVGTFDTYQEGEYTYCTLRDAELAN